MLLCHVKRVHIGDEVETFDSLQIKITLKLADDLTEYQPK